MKKTFLTSITLIWATAAAAHSPLESTVPVNEAVVEEVPSEIVLDFKGNVRLTRVTLTHAAHEADLDLDGFNGFVSDYTIPMQSMGAGTYQIEWRGLGDDGHTMNGTFSFTVEE
ncbi:copper resistance CopC family protein [uncultured Tateyamaria sp.]|uniref:copper resistance CopC family protein n=1 Tax=uncultured Tateyamaria sp. TaxID=455651 RepID=UPI00260A2CA0|nr:copper resistance CopC family protein [uncultured Tateyamaria sp.]